MKHLGLLFILSLLAQQLSFAQDADMLNGTLKIRKSQMCSFEVTLPVPDLTGRTLDEAQWILNTLTLKVGEVKWDANVTSRSTAVVYK